MLSSRIYQIYYSLEVLWSYGFRSIAHLFYGHVVSGLVHLNFVAFDFRFGCSLEVLWRMVSGLLFTWSCMTVWSQVYCSLEVLWSYGLRSVHLKFYGRMVRWSVVHLTFYGRMVPGLLFTWCCMVVWSQVCCSLDVLWRIVIGLLFTWCFMAYGYRFIVHLRFYGRMVSDLLLKTWYFISKMSLKGDPEFKISHIFIFHPILLQFCFLWIDWADSFRKYVYGCVLSNLWFRRKTQLKGSNKTRILNFELSYLTSKITHFAYFERHI